MSIIGITTYCIPAIINLYRYLKYNIRTSSLKIVEFSKASVSAAINNIKSAISTIGSSGINYCNFLYIFLSECSNSGIRNINNMWLYITDSTKQILGITLNLTSQVANILIGTGIEATKFSIELGGFILISLFKGLLMLFTLIPFEMIGKLINLIKSKLITGLATVISTITTLFGEIPPSNSLE